MFWFVIMDASDVMSKRYSSSYHYGSFGAFERKVNAPNDGYIINANLLLLFIKGCCTT
jgi:hypothetical protein